MDFGDKVFSPESSVFTVRGGDLFIQMRGKLFPKEGGAECGSSFAEFNLSDHIRDLIADALSGTR